MFIAKAFKTASLISVQLKDLVLTPISTEVRDRKSLKGTEKPENINYIQFNTFLLMLTLWCPSQHDKMQFYCVQG